MAVKVDNSIEQIIASIVAVGIIHLVPIFIVIGAYYIKTKDIHNPTRLQFIEKREVETQRYIQNLLDRYDRNGDLMLQRDELRDYAIEQPDHSFK